jgi:hypothetical protein
MLTKNKNPRANYFRRIMVLPLAVLVFAAFSLKAKTDIKLQNKIDAESIVFQPGVAEKTLPGIIISADQYSITDTVPLKIVTGINPDGKVPLYILNGTETDKTTATAIKPEDILDVRVIKDDVAIKIYGDKGKNGVVIINTKPGFGIAKEKWTSDVVRMIGNNTDRSFGSDPLMIVDNKEYPGKTLSEVTDIIGETRFASVEIYTSEEAVKTFGERAKDGAIVALTKSAIKIADGKLLTDLNIKYKADSLYLQKQKMLLEQQKNADLDYEKNQLDYALAANDLKKSVDEKKLQEKQLTELKLNAEQLKPNYEQNLKTNLAPGKLAFQEKQLVELKQKLNSEQFNNAKLAYAESLNTNLAFKKIAIKEEVRAAKNNMIFTQVETNPQFTGGQGAWINFLQANLKANVPVNNGAKAGKYTVVLKFIVNADGTLSDISCEHDPGYGICAEAIRFIKTTPKWQPAKQNGKKVNAYKKQPITFVIEE